MAVVLLAHRPARHLDPAHGSSPTRRWTWHDRSTHHHAVPPGRRAQRDRRRAGRTRPIAARPPRSTSPRHRRARDRCCRCVVVLSRPRFKTARSTGHRRRSTPPSNWFNFDELRHGVHQRQDARGLRQHHDHPRRLARRHHPHRHHDRLRHRPVRLPRQEARRGPVPARDAGPRRHDPGRDVPDHQRPRPVRHPRRARSCSSWAPTSSRSTSSCSSCSRSRARSTRRR